MSTFEKALAFTLQWQGGYVNDPDDPGGATNKGITQKTYDAWLKEKGRASVPVKNIPDAEVSAIYQGSYWAEAHCPEIPGVAAQAAFDIAVNMEGAGRKTGAGGRRGDRRRGLGTEHRCGSGQAGRHRPGTGALRCPRPVLQGSRHEKPHAQEIPEGMAEAGSGPEDRVAMQGREQRGFF